MLENCSPSEESADHKPAAAVVPSDLEIAQAATIQPIDEVAEKLGIPQSALIAYGNDKAKIRYDYLGSVETTAAGRLILVTAISPTLAGEGKTTVSVGLCDALWRLGQRTLVCLREPSLGPCFGMKGGAAGGGYAQVVPMEDINLHFTGDFHAIGAANNLLAAMVDNHLHWGNALELDPRRITWRRAVDMNDRALRQIVCGLGGATNGVPRESGFDISVASEVMAVFCLATSLEDLKRRLGDMVIGYSVSGRPVQARELQAEGAMAALLRDAFQPNIVQTLENNPALIHGGPFANIAHGCSSVIATQTALKLADLVVTEAGFGADLGAEKFFNIKCRKAGLKPAAAVLVATTRALKQNGGVPRNQVAAENVDAVRRGCDNLGRHMANVARFGVPVVVTINRFAGDSDAELEAISAYCTARDTPCVVSSHWAEGGRGALALGQEVLGCLEQDTAAFEPLYADEVGLLQKVTEVAQKIYGASGVEASARIRGQFRQLEKDGFAHLPVCLAKTPYSFSADPKALGAASGHELPIREVRLAAGAGFVIVICGQVMTMPGLPRHPAAEGIDLDSEKRVTGLF